MHPLTPTVEHRWHALDDGVLVIGLAMLRTLSVWPVLQMTVLSLFPLQSYLFPFWLVFGLLVGGSLAAQAGAFRFSDRTASIMAALAGLVAVGLVLYLALEPDPEPFWSAQGPAVILAHPGRVVLVTLVAVWLWWWGMRAGLEPISYETLARNFTGGLVALLVVLILNAGAQLLALGSLLAALMAFLALGLFLLALASIQDARRYESVRAGSSLPLARHWWVTVGAIIGLLLLVSLLLSQVFVPSTLERLAAWTAAALGMLWQGVVTLLLLVLYPLAMLVDWLLQLLHLQPLQAPALPSAMQQGLTEQLDNYGNGGAQTVIEVPAAVWGMLVLLVAVGIVIIFLIAFRRSRRVNDDDVAEAHESILSLDLIKAQLASLWRKRNGVESAPHTPFVALTGEEPNVRIRRAYQELLAWGASQGLSRAPGMTPDRYSDLLADAFPAQREPLLVITDAYGAVRYGQAPASEASAQAASAAWRQIIASAGQESSRA